MAINDVAGERCIMYEIFFVNFWVIILCPVFVR